MYQATDSLLGGPFRQADANLAAPLPPFFLPSPARPSWLSPSLGLPALLALVGGSLAFTNPGPDEFADYAGGRLVQEITAQVCEGDRLPSLLRLALTNCSELVASQRQALGAVVLQQTRRTNLGLFSLYHSDLGGQQVLRWRVPRLKATVVGVAGQFVLVQGGEAEPDSDAEADAEP
ncbi:DUF4359 domain-containing protein [Cyanobium sp. NIES-981]|uniref:DUF4359 domain-containing protein n=1 Tax=Cyanobium sp. NIES-981 TaxID=1851505 RepID=UPI0007DD23F5|nr:DUF4359 domain-containing protein [Cyanobium sp. NIES-981]SBO43061.1 conserved protein of unknown function [Cyanobium sp. NIES-981]